MSTSPTPELPAGHLERWVQRRQARRRRVGWIVGGVALVGVVVAWVVWYTMHRHWLAASALRLDGVTVLWDLGDGAWRQGGSTRVSATGGVWYTSNLSDEDLSHLTDLRHVESLSLVRCLRLTDDGLKVLRELPELRSLDLTMTRPDTSLSASRLTDAMLDHLAGLDRLEDLTLVDVAITDRGLARFPALPNLRFLDLSGTPITDAALVDLVDRLPRLETLCVEGTAVTPEGAEALRQHRPGLLVTHEPTSGIGAGPY